MTPPLLHPDGLKRCPWPKQDPLYVAYHDEEWGVPEYDDRALYEKLYCARGEMENRIKECQLDLFADRTSTGTMRANQLRLWLSSMAYVLISALRRIALAATRFADATCGTIRLKLFKIGAQVRISGRRVKFSMASACTYTDVFRTAWAALDSAAL